MHVMCLESSVHDHVCVSTVYLVTYFELSGNAVLSINFHFSGILSASEMSVLVMPERPVIMGRDVGFRDIQYCSSSCFSQHNARRMNEKRDF